MLKDPIRDKFKANANRLIKLHATHPMGLSIRWSGLDASNAKVFIRHSNFADNPARVDDYFDFPDGVGLEGPFGSHSFILTHPLNHLFIQFIKGNNTMGTIEYVANRFRYG